MEDFIGKYNGGQIESRLDKVKDMVGATASQAGEDGLVPAPAKGDEGRFLCGDGTWKDVVVKPDYTVFDIVMEISSSGNLSISQENYNKLLEKLPSNAVNIFPVRDNGVYISSIFGGYNVNDDNSIWLYIKQDAGILQNSSIQISIYQNLTVAITSGMNYLIPVNDGIDVFTNLTGGPSGSNTKQLTIHTTGDGTKSLMDDGKYRKLPVYGRNLLLGSGKEVSNSNYNIANYWLAEQIPNGAQVTLTLWGEIYQDKTDISIYNSGGTVYETKIDKDKIINGKASVTWNWIVGDSSNTFVRVYASPNSITGISTIHKIKLEYGDLSTEWTPAWEDIPDIEERYAYGVEWDMASSNRDGKRVGNMQLHRELPVQSKMRRCLLDRDGGVKEYLDNELSWGESYLDYAVMTEMPEHWYKLYFNGTKFRMMLSEIPLPGYKHVDKFYISTYEARMYRTDNLLCSAAGASKLSDPNSTNFRGGDNTAEWDDTYSAAPSPTSPETNSGKPPEREAAVGRCTPTTPTRPCSGYSPSSTPHWTARSLSTPRRTLTVSPKVA